jgi:hypothetical protein
MIAEGTHCSTCQTKRDETRAHGTLCKAVLAQGPKRGTPCTRQATCEEGYCGKHTLAIRVEEAAREGKRICDDGKRACKQYTQDGKLKCESCLEALRVQDHATYVEKRDNGLCLGCGCALAEFTQGFRTKVQRCPPCYESMRQTEFSRPERTRNYKEESKLHTERHYRQYIMRASKRNIHFDLSIETFTALVNTPCSYCNRYVETEVIGIDRVDNNVGYTNENTVPCCETCNIMKGTLTVDEFMSHISAIYHTCKDRDQSRLTSVSPPSYVKPRKILDMYNRGAIQSYIDMCIVDGRSPLFIEKMKFLSTIQLTEKEARNFIRSSLCADVQHEYNQNRQRISKKELFGYLEMGRVDLCIQRYAEVHGLPAGFEDDIHMLVRCWSNDMDLNAIEFGKVLVKYQNKRAHHSRVNNITA